MRSKLTDSIAATASFATGWAMPVAFPNAPQWLGVAVFVLFAAIWTITFYFQLRKSDEQTTVEKRQLEELDAQKRDRSKRHWRDTIEGKF